MKFCKIIGVSIPHSEFLLHKYTDFNMGYYDILNFDGACFVGFSSLNCEAYFKLQPIKGTTFQSGPILKFTHLYQFLNFNLGVV